MSLLPPGISVDLANALDLLSPALFNARSIGPFIADCTIEETHSDELTITENPVDQGAAITDHSFKRPASVVIQVGFSNSSPGADGNPDYCREQYANFLQLQASRQPFEVVTGKRSYSQLLISRLSTRTDEKTENSLILTVECREVILVSSSTVTVPNSNQANPQVTGGTLQRGTVAAAGVNV